MKIVDYIKSSYYEFRDHVTWPNWSSLQQDTIIVAVTTVILAIFLYLVDTFFGDVIIKNIFTFLR